MRRLVALLLLASLGVAQAQETRLAVDPARSSITILVYRAGLLSGLGHNHVVESRAVSGTVWVAEPVAASRFEVEFPVAELIVDDPAARQAAGADFASMPSAKDREGTRANMLGPAQLDAARAPGITLRSTAIRGGGPRYDVTAEVRIRDHASTVQFPAEVARSGQEIRVTGELSLRQTALGLTPFSAAGGALKVRDELRVRFDIVAAPR